MSSQREVNRLRQAAEAGDMDAADELGDILWNNGDLAGAEYWFRREAAVRDMGAYSLGLLLAHKGESTGDRNCFNEASEWLKKAVVSTDSEFASLLPAANAVLGQIMFDLGNLDEAERWLNIAVSLGDDDAPKILEELHKARSGGTIGEAPQSSGDAALQTFEVTGVMFYDGSGHRLGPSLCTLTRARLIIEDARGGIHQILLRDINGVNSPSKIISAAMLRINVPGAAYDVYCKNRDQKNQLAAWISRAIRGAV